MNTDAKPVGLTKDVGFTFGIRRTFPISLVDAWALLHTDAAIKAYLGDVPELSLEQGKAFQTADGTTGEFKIVQPLSHLRFTWRPSGWEKASTIQIRVIPSENGTVIAFHQEHLKDSKTREAMGLHWKQAMLQLKQMICPQK